MKHIKNIVKQIDAWVMRAAREKHYAAFRQRLENTNPTIISSDCFGGIVYHNLGLEFRSPTINLAMSKEDFIRFAGNLKGYLEADLTEITDHPYDYPVGKLEFEGNEITIRFMHYKTFAKAKQKWEERKKRVDFSNIYIIQTIPNVTAEDIRAFDALPYRNKMLLANCNITGSENVVTHKVFEKTNYKSGEVLRFKSLFARERYIDDLDYVGFLNRPNE